MNFELNEEQALLRDSARDFLREEWPVSELRRMLDPEDAPTGASQLWDKMAGLGWPALLVPEDDGGLGLGMFDLAVLMEETGGSLIPGTLHASGLLATAALASVGTADARREYLPAIAEGEIKATVGIYEPRSGWTAMLLDPTPAPVVTKRFVPSCAQADLVLFFNRSGGNSVELAVAREPEVEQLNSMDVTRPLSETRCPRERLEVIGTGTVADLQATVDTATIGLAAEMVGGAAKVLAMTVEYVKSRKQFGRPVGSFQAVQHRAADMLIEIEKARTGVYYAAAVADELPDQLGRAASIAKTAANRAFASVAEAGIQLHGGLGFTWEQDLHLYLKRAKASEVTYGDTPWHLDRIAHGLGLT